MSEFEGVMLIDRAMTGGCEIRFDGRPAVVFPANVDRKMVSATFADWLFANAERECVWTTAGAFTHRYAVEGGSEDFYARNPQAADTEVIEIDAKRVEGWNTEAAGRTGTTWAVPLKPVAADYTRDADGARVVAGR